MTVNRTTTTTTSECSPLDCNQSTASSFRVRERGIVHKSPRRLRTQLELQRNSMHSYHALHPLPLGHLPHPPTHAINLITSSIVPPQGLQKDLQKNNNIRLGRITRRINNILQGKDHLGYLCRFLS